MPDTETTARHPQPIAPSVPQTIVGSLKSKYNVPNGAQTIATAVKQISQTEENTEPDAQAVQAAVTQGTSLP